MDKSSIHYAKVSKLTFWFCTIACIIFFGPMIILRDQAQKYVDAGMHGITYSTDWLWEFVVFGCLIFVVWLAFGPYGKVKLGSATDKPEFSTFTWIGMMFCGSTGGALVYWSMIEPIYYLQYPPFWLKAFSPEAAQFSLGYAFLHWGVSAWATFAVPTVAFAYMYYVRKRPFLYPSYACRGVLGKRVDGWLGKVIDAIVSIGLVGGMATTLGFIIPMTSKLIADYAGIQDTVTLKMALSVLFAIIYGWSAYNGLKGGIAKLADFNMYISFALIAFVFIVGNNRFFLSLLSDNLGAFLNNFIRMSFYTDPISKSGFPQDWTVFYWAWWLAWAMYVGLFAARISKGRTIRTVVLTMCISGMVSCMIFFMVFGGHIVDAILNRGVDLAKMLTEQGGPAIVSWMMNDLPGSKIVVPAIIFYLIVATATGTDAASFTLANMTCVEIKDGVEPPKWNRLFWAFVIFISSVALMLVGGMNVVKLASVLTSIPVMPLIIILAISIVKWLRADFGVAPPMITNKYDDITKDTDEVVPEAAVIPVTVIDV